MSNSEKDNKVIQAWINENYRENLTEEELSQLPLNPAGMIDISDEASHTLGGGRRRFTWRLGRFIKRRAKRTFPLLRRTIGSPF
jgi:mersacidin/lichenicidin family type 2 lantibiotic